jgi:flagellar biosynthesis protein
MPERRKVATALQYEQGEGAPKVVASGQALVAERILAAAREAGVPIQEDAPLAEALAQLELGDEVPEELWQAVAEVLVWALGLDRKARAQPPGSRADRPTGS